MPNQIPLTDLRYNNIISYSKLHTETKQAIIKGLWENYVLLEYEYKDSHHIKNKNIVSSELKYISGIPLTEEWLEIFSFKETTDRPYKDQKAYYIFEDGKMIIYSAGDLYKRTGDGGFLRITGRWEYGRFNRIDFVHDIQNCIHALTGTELTLKQ